MGHEINANKLAIKYFLQFWVGRETNIMIYTIQKHSASLRSFRNRIFCNSVNLEDTQKQESICVLVFNTSALQPMT